MYTRLAALIAATLMTATAASAATISTRGTTENTEQCGQLMELTTKTVEEQQDVGQKARDQIDALLVQLKEQCAANQFQQADETAALIRGMVATE